jgi:2-polyprenyl-3-methyl-5-hydroxy-6-metoxy-1,4-benzoquinol methylase
VLASPRLSAVRYVKLRLVTQGYYRCRSSSLGAAGRVERVASEEDRRHWSELNCAYSGGWETPARQAMSARELEFVLEYARRTPVGRVLDVGVGNGRILAGLLSVAPPDCEAYGVDLADEMVEVTRTRFADEPRVKDLRVCDVSREELPVDGITAVRILKYSENWRKIVERVGARLSPDGVFVFSLSNRRSLNRLSRPYAVRTHHATAAQVADVCRRADLRVLAFSGSTKLPYGVYTLSSSTALAGVLLAAEKSLDAVLGRSTLTRELFVAVAQEPAAHR